MNNQPLVKEVLLDASPERVWKALTDKKELSQWSFEMDKFEPVEGFEFTFLGEKDNVKFVHLCKVLEIVKGKKMKWLWTYQDIPGDTYVTFELFPEGDKTRLKLTHEGLEKLPQDENYARSNFEGGWNQLIGVLIKKHVEAGS
jgi:uncharacterized protein YndB with AHSA1/START domain